ncbi:MAG TPA: quinone-dependent dihydroorotate dehydrogenase [Candidatus Thermoplasmatota archaeon]|nr:quinone-dependent dihydroorotate dehydrogenase [Candidatus Thermoplasmatota archaeon]
MRADVFYRATRAILFRFEAEKVHEFALRRLEQAGRRPRLVKGMRNRYFMEDARLSQELWGLRFPNPVGIAAGFDKNARLVDVLPHLGFGFVEVGTVTSEAQSGNPKPRLFRLPKDGALINRLGFNNDGAETVAGRLAKSGPHMVPVGVNIGKARRVTNAEATADYLKTFEKLWPYGDYFVVNVSSPNTPGLRDLQARDSIEEIVVALKAKNAELSRAHGGRPRPLLVKVSPDLAPKDLEGLVEVAKAQRLDGIIATNTTTGRVGLTKDPQQEGGLSGAPLRERSTRTIRAIHQQTEGRIPIVGVGGVFTADDAWEKLLAGASLLQLYTGFIYGGPATASDINEGLVELMDQNKVEHLADIVGTG